MEIKQKLFFSKKECRDEPGTNRNDSRTRSCRFRIKLSPEQAQVVSVLAKHTTGKQSMGIKDDDLYKTVNLEFTKLLEILAMLVEIQAFGEKKASSRNWWNVCLLLQID